jgi:NHLM bacteriocin system ABC transporter ATP-binding protein
VTRADPGVSFRSTSLEDALRLLGPSVRADFRDVALEAAVDDTAAIERAAEDAGVRARRVILDTRWWKHAGAPMIARLAERRRQPRGDGDEPRGRGWVALVPHPYDGYRMRAIDPADGAVIEWRVDADIAARLAPHAFTFHRRFPDRPVGPRDLIDFALAQGRRDMAFLVGAGLAAALVGLTTPMATGWLIDRAIPAGRSDQVLALIAGLAVAGVSLIALDILRALATTRFESRLGVAMQAALVDRVLSAPARFFRPFASGDLALRIGAVNTLQRTFIATTLGAIVTLIFALANVGLMLHYSLRLTAAALAVACFVAAASATFGRLRLRIGARIEALDGQLGAFTYELFAGIPKLRAAGAEARAFERWYARYDAFRVATRTGSRLANGETVALGVLQPLATIAVLAIAWRLTRGAGLSTGTFVAFHAAMLAFLGAVHALTAAVLDVVNLKPAWDRARPILETVPEDPPRRGERHEPAGRVAMRGVSFAYADGEPVLHGIDLDIGPGEFVAIVGPSGAGKSTLVRLLLGFDDPVRGRVEYDGRDLRTLDRRSLRMRIGTVLQDGRLWEGDLYANIAGAANVSVEEAWEAARAAGLADEIDAMPMGIYTRVGEALSTLSGGQRQRLLIARALAGKPRVLLLDEATSALDNLSQAKVLEGLARLAATRIVIAHRLETVRRADRIVVLERGRVVQQGTFAALAAEQGPFAALLERQTA